MAEVSPSDQRLRCWGILDRDGKLHYCAFYSRQQAMAYAAMGCIGAHEYDRLKTHSARWKLAYSRGYRLVRVEVRRV